MATERRIFYTWANDEQNNPEASLQLTCPDTLKHIKKVLRLTLGDPLTLVNPNTQSTVSATLTALDKNTLVLNPDWKTHQTPPPTLPRITLAMAFIKEKRWEWCLQKATELGVTEIIPVISQRITRDADDVKKELAKKNERWTEILKAAALQSEGLFIPKILPPQDLNNFLAHSTCYDVKLAPLARLEQHSPKLNPIASTQTVVSLIGPEGGWTASEETSIIDAGFTSVSLSPRVLRAETAAISALTLINLNAYD